MADTDIHKQLLADTDFNKQLLANTDTDFYKNLLANSNTDICHLRSSFDAVIKINSFDHHLNKQTSKTHALSYSS